jgi:hypothetical protein
MCLDKACQVQLAGHRCAVLLDVKVNCTCCNCTTPQQRMHMCSNAVSSLPTCACHVAKCGEPWQDVFPAAASKQQHDSYQELLPHPTAASSSKQCLIHEQCQHVAVDTALQSRALRQ